VNDLAAGAVMVWAVLMGFACWYFPESSFLFTWPTLFALIALALVVNSQKRQFSSWILASIFCLCVLPGLILVTQTASVVYLGFNLNKPYLVLGLEALLLGLLIPFIRFVTPKSQLLLPVLSTFVFVFFLVAAI